MYESLGGRPAATSVKPSHSSGYIPSLDGWRAIAILAVLMDHDAAWSLHGHSNEAWHEYGGWGVFLFFVISGFLVCGRMLADEKRYGQLRLKSFYIRRICRIQPPAVAYLALISLLVACGVSHEQWSRIGGALAGMQNLQFRTADELDPTGSRWLTGHFWTLAIEEQFYILLSLLLVTTRRYRARLIGFLIALLLVGNRLAIHFGHTNLMRNPRSTEFMVQYLLIAALMAVLVQRPGVKAFAVKHLQPWKVFAATAVAKVCWFMFAPLHAEDATHLYAWILFPGTLYFYAFNFWVLATAYHPESWTTRFLEWRPLRFIGGISYALYLWHALFFIGRAPRVGFQSSWLRILTERPWRYVATFAVAVLSTYTLELFFRRLGHRLAPPATPGHVALEIPSLQEAQPV